MELDVTRYREKALVRALVEQDLTYLGTGEPLEILGKKLFGVEVYNYVADTCADPSPRKQTELRRLKWHYLSEILTAPNGPTQARARVLQAADNADDDAASLVRNLGCESHIVKRILAEVGD